MGVYSYEKKNKKFSLSSDVYDISGDPMDVCMYIQTGTTYQVVVLMEYSRVLVCIIDDGYHHRFRSTMIITENNSENDEFEKDEFGDCKILKKN